METRFSGPEFTFRGDKIDPSAHVVAELTVDGVEQKWRMALTMQDNGTWEFASAIPPNVEVTPEFEAVIDASVAEAVAQFGIEHPAQLPEEPEDRSETGAHLRKEQIRSLLEQGKTAEAVELILGLL